MIRLTKKNRQQILEQNEGYSTKTYYEGKNFREERVYNIKDGKLYINSSGKTSWADSRFNDSCIASDEEVHRFLYKNKDYLNLDSIE